MGMSSLEILGFGALVVVGGFIAGGYLGGHGTFKKNPLCALSLIGVVIMAASCFVSVPTGHTGIITIFGKVKPGTLDAGIHVLPPWEEVVNMDNRVQKTKVDMSGTTSDMQDVQITFTLNYQISKVNASEIYKTIGESYSDTVIDPQIASTVKSVMAKYEAVELIAERTAVAAAINKELEHVLNKYNIEVVDTSIENMKFSAEFNESIEAKVIAEQELERAQTEQAKLNLEVEQAAQRKVTEAQGIADANAIISNSYTAEILQKMFIEKWNGELPNVVGDADTMMDVSSYVNTEAK